MKQKLLWVCVISLWLAIPAFAQNYTQQITAIQYYFDTDPGVGQVGNGAIVSISPTSNYNQSLPVTVPGSLSPGFHNLFTRARDEFGQWSLPERRLFFIKSPLPAPQNITAYQYYFDTDPGVGITGNGAVVPVSQTGNLNTTISVVAPNTLSAGFHNLFMRTQNTAGVWSLVERRLFYITTPLPSTQDITAYQYYFDTDPGVGITGNGAVVPVSQTGNYNTTISVVTPNTLSAGFHNLFMRTQNTAGVWSLVERRLFYITTPLPFTQDITAYQYYFDTEPGVGINGNGAIVPVTPTSNYNAPVSVSVPNTLSTGFHNLYIRTKNATGIWSLIERRLFFINSTQSTTQTVTALEFYYDSDPGAGNGNPISVTSAANINTSFPINVPCLANGNHYLYVRAKDEFARWSIIERDTVIVTSGVSAGLVTPAGPISICNSDSVTLTANLVSGITYQWLLNGIDIPGANSNSYTADSAGNYSLKTTCGSSFVTSNVVVVSTVSLVTYFADADGDGFGNALHDTMTCILPVGFVTNNSDCNDSSNTIHNPVQYFVDNDHDGFGSTTTAMVCSLTPPVGYSLNSTDCNDTNAIIYPGATEICGNGIDENCNGQIDEGPLATAGIDQSFCSDTSTTLAGNNPSSGTGVWSLISGTGTFNNPNQFNTGVHGLSTGINILRWTVTFNSCIGFDEVSITVTQPPLIDFSGLGTSYCLNATSSVLSGIPSGGIFSGTGISQNIFTPSVAGQISVTYISQPYFACPADTIIKTTTVNSLPSVSVISSNGSVLCKDSSTLLTAISAASNYQWNSGSVSNTTVVSSASAYIVTVTDNNNCTASSTPVIIAFDAPLHINVAGSGSICQGETVGLTFNAASMLWSTGQTTSSINVSPAATTTYYVQGTSAHSCAYSDSTKITVTPFLPPGPVTNMFPVNNNQNLDLPVTLSWLPGIYNTKFDLFIWADTLTQPVTPFQSNITGLSTIVSSGLTYGISYNWRIISRNGICFSTSGPIQSFTIRNLPDLTVQNVQVPGTANAGQNITANWQVHNTGTGNTLSQQWNDGIYLSFDTVLQIGFDTYLGGKPNFAALTNGQSYNNSFAFNLPASIAGSYYIIVATDAFNQLSETNDANNTSYNSTSLAVTIPPLPDLRVTAVVNQANAFSGNVVPVTYTVKNFGSVPAVAPIIGYKNVLFEQFNYLDPMQFPCFGLGSPTSNTYLEKQPFYFYYPIRAWYDKLNVTDQPFLISSSAEARFPYPSNITSLFPLYLPLHVPQGYDPTFFTCPNNDLVLFDAFDFIDSASSIQPVLLPDSSYTITRSVTLPKHVFGPHYIFTTTDDINYIDETPFESNNQNSNIINIFLTPPPDLFITNINAPVTASNAQPVTVSWSVINQGFTPTDTTWDDTLYLSSSPNYNISGAIKLGGRKNTNILNAGDSYNQQLNVTLPENLIAGTYYFYVKTDPDNKLFEYNNEGNNLRRSDTSVVISNPDLQVTNVTVPSSANAGSLVTIGWSITNSSSGGVYNHVREDKIFLSSSSTFNINTAIFLGSSSFTESVAAGATILKQKSVTLPATFNGNYHVFVYTDITNAIFENANESNNVNSSSPVIQINLASWADLVGASFTTSDSLISAESNPFSYTVNNVGNLAANGSWVDSIFVSKKSIWNRDSAVFVKLMPQSQVLAPAANYNVSNQIRVPLTSGIPNGNDSSIYYFYLITDAGNTIFENTGENNNIFRSNAVFITNNYVDHIVTSVIGSDTAYSGRPYPVQWAVLNQGGPTNSNYYSHWYDGVYLSTDTILNGGDQLFGYFNITQTLNTNDNYSRTYTFTITNGFSGDFYLIAKTDLNAEITGEINKANNTNLLRDVNGNPKLIHIIAVPPPDLKVLLVDVPAQGLSGQPINVIYTIKNDGTGVTYPSSWEDKIYLSSDYTINGGDINLGTNPSASTLLPGQTYTDTVQVFLPIQSFGNFVILLKTDNADAMYEGGNENNNFGFGLITISQPLPSDLIAEDITAPDSIVAGENIGINWSIKNIGSNPATGFSKDGVYFSKDTLWDINDPLFASVSNTINIPPGTTEPHSWIAPLINVPLGFHYIIVRADLLNNIFENNENNNITASVIPVFVTVNQLFIDSLTPAVLSNYKYKYYRISVPDSLKTQTLLVSLKGDSIFGHNELYASFEKFPTRTVYDYGYNSTGFNKQEVIIPSIDSGTYYIAVYGHHTNNPTQNITIKAEILPFAIRTVDADNGGNTGNVTVKITGSKFTSNMQAHLLSNVSSLDIVSSSIYFVNSTKVYATFNLNQKPIGIYDLSLTKPDSTSVVLDNAFEIQAGNSGTFYIGGISNSGMDGNPNVPGCDPGMEAGINNGLQLTVNSPAQTRQGRIVPMTILYGNAGNVDIPVPTRIFSGYFVPDGFDPNPKTTPPVGLTVSDIDLKLKSVYIEFSEPGGPPNVLRAGATGGITVFTKATRIGKVKYRLK